MVKEVFSMTKEQKEIITRLQRDGKGYRTIAAETCIPVNSVKSWIRRHPLEGKNCGRCLQCGAPLSQTPGRRQKKYCSDRCRMTWWSTHPEMRSGGYGHICLVCGKEFVNSRNTASYCGRACFARARMKVTRDGSSAI